jgi:type IV fimbrial biogenesis protein FimT
MTATRSRSRGFNLLELMITVTVATMFLMIVPPSFSAIIKGVRLKSQIYDFNGALDFARSEAVKRGTWVTVCASADQAACGPSGTQWESGWIVFVDKNNNQTVDTGEGPALRAAGALLSTYTLRGTSTTTLTTYLTFNAKGVSSASGQLVLCQGGQIKPARAVLIGASGRVTTARDNNGVPVNAGGTNMTTCTP